MERRASGTFRGGGRRIRGCAYARLTTRESRYRAAAVAQRGSFRVPALAQYGPLAAGRIIAAYWPNNAVRVQLQPRVIYIRRSRGPVVPLRAPFIRPPDIIIGFLPASAIETFA